MIRHSELIGLSVTQEGKGSMEGYKTDNIIYSRNSLTALALMVKYKEKLIKRFEIILFDNIKSINNNELVITSKYHILSPYEIPEIYAAFNDPIKIIGFHIYNEKNDLIGIIKDIIIQKNTGKILAFIIGNGLIDDLIEGYSILPVVDYIDIKNDHILVDDIQLNQIMSPKGGLKKLLGIE